MRHGPGVFIWSSINGNDTCEIKYEGEWMNDKQHGTGKF